MSLFSARIELNCFSTNMGGFGFLLFFCLLLSKVGWALFGHMFKFATQKTLDSRLVPVRYMIRVSPCSQGMFLKQGGIGWLSSMPLVAIHEKLVIVNGFPGI